MSRAPHTSRALTRREYLTRRAPSHVARPRLRGQALRARNVSAQHVPLGWHDSLAWGSSASSGSSASTSRGARAADGSDGARTSPAAASADGGDEEGDIDVLFYGKLNAYRAARLAELRAAGVRTLHANAMGRPVFGRELDALLARARIVLSLRYFNHDDEWKMTRWLRPIANGVLVVSERSGAPSEQARWEGGVIFSDAAALVPTVLRYLNDGDARRAAVARARVLLRAQPAVEVLRPHVAAVARRQCAAAGPATGDVGVQPHS